MFTNRPRGRRPSRRRSGSAETQTPPAPETAEPVDFSGPEPYTEPPAQRPAMVADPLPPPSPPPVGSRSGSGRSSGAAAKASPSESAASRRAGPWPEAQDPGQPRPAESAAAAAAQKVSLVSGSLKTAEVCGRIIYQGTAQGDAVVVGLFDVDQPGIPLEYWVNLDGPGPYVLEGIKPGRYELHACLASAISENGFPRDILATGQVRGGQPLGLSASQILEDMDIELFDEVPRAMLQGIDTVFYDVSDLDASVDFYRNVLGLSLTLKERSWAEFDTGSSTLALRRRPVGATPGYHPSVRRTPDVGGAIVVFRVQNLDEVRQVLARRGVKFIGRVIDIPEARWTTFSDPDGNRMQLFERKS